MSIVATNESNSSFELIPPGQYLARCYSMIHMGTVTETINGRVSQVNKVRIAWELPTMMKVFKEGEPAKPISHFQEYTLSMHEKAGLRKLVEQWRSKPLTPEEAKGFDISKLIGVPAILTIAHRASTTGKIRAEIASILYPRKDLNGADIIVPPAINPNFEFNYEPLIVEKWNAVPEYMRKKMVDTPEFKKACAEANINPATLVQANPQAQGQPPVQQQQFQPANQNNFPPHVDQSSNKPGNFTLDTQVLDDTLPF